MGTPAYNLVIVRGTKEDLDTFEKLANKTQSEAIRFDQLLPLPEYLAKEEEMSDEVQAFHHIIYGSKWVGAFGILIEKSDSLLKYYFNSKCTKAQLDYVAIKYSSLSFTHVFREIAGEWRFGVIEYEIGERTDEIIVYDDKMDWQIASDIHSYLSIVELWHKFQILKQYKPDIAESMKWSYRTDEYTYFTLFNENEYLKNYDSFYESLYLLERNLETRSLDYARNGTAYPFITNSPIFQLQFLEQNFLPSEKKSDRILTLLDFITKSKSVKDSTKLYAFIFVQQKMNIQDWLYPAVDRFLKSRIKKMKLYLIAAADPSKKKEVDQHWEPVLAGLLSCWIEEDNFQGWPGLGKEQTLFFQLRAKVEAILEYPDNERDSANELPF